MEPRASARTIFAVQPRYTDGEPTKPTGVGESVMTALLGCRRRQRPSRCRVVRTRVMIVAVPVRAGGGRNVSTDVEHAEVARVPA